MKIKPKSRAGPYVSRSRKLNGTIEDEGKNDQVPSTNNNNSKNQVGDEDVQYSKMRPRDSEEIVKNPSIGFKTKETIRQDEAAVLVSLIKDKKKVYDVYEKEHLKDNATSQELFFEGVPLEFLKQNPPAFGRGLKKNKLRFFPSLHTSEIFIRCLRNRPESRIIYISSMKGIGKTYGLALFVFLMRCDLKKRVLYIHNPQTFINNPYTCLKDDLQSAFSEEFEQNPDLKTQLDELYNPHINRKEIVEALLTEIIQSLNKKGISTYFVIDGYNVLNDHLNHPIVHTDFSKVYPLFLANTGVEKIILMVSATNEEYAETIAREDPNYQFEPSEKFPEEMITRFIDFILGDDYDLDKDIVAEIREMTGDNLRQIDYICRKCDRDRIFSDQKKI